MKQLIVISTPEKVKEEAYLINALFDEGLQHLHLRKPEYSTDEWLQLIEAIKPQYQERLTFPANLSKQLAALPSRSKRLHFFEYLRLESDRGWFHKLKEENYILSTSIHETAAYSDLPTEFDYTFFSPVFDSISKKDYKAMDKEQLNIPDIKQSTKLIALGGIQKDNCQKALEYGFDGVAVLGAIWQSSAPVKAFTTIRDIINQY